MSAPGPAVYWDEVVEVLRAFGCRFALAGAYAANAYRLKPRTTADADLLTEFRPGIVEALVARGWQARIAGLTSAPSMIRLAKGAARVDLMIVGTGYQDLAISRAVDGALSPEDVIVHKLIAGRIHDLDDIRQIFAAGVVLDAAYVEEWAARWDVLERWRALLAEDRSTW